MNLDGFDRWFLAKKSDPSFIAAFRSYIKAARDRNVAPERATLREWAYDQYEALPQRPKTVAEHIRASYG